MNEIQRRLSDVSSNSEPLDCFVLSSSRDGGLDYQNDSNR